MPATDGTSTGIQYAGFFPNAIIGYATIEDDIFEAARSFLKTTIGGVVGEAVIDNTLTGLGIVASADPLNDRKLTVVGNLPAMSEGGALIRAGDGISLEQVTEGTYTYDLQNPAWFEECPFENNGGDTYNVYLRASRYPVNIGIADNGGRGYSRWVDVPGITINPDSVTTHTVGTGLQLNISTALTTLGHPRWLTSNTNDPDWSYDVAVWLDTDVAGVDIASDDPEEGVYRGVMVKDPTTSSWMVRIDGAAAGDKFLGQGDTLYSTTASDYKICIFGPFISKSDFTTNPDYVLLGTVISGGSENIDTSGQRIMEEVSSLSHFGADHNTDTGHHKYIRESDNIGPGATASIDRHQWIAHESEGYRPVYATGGTQIDVERFAQVNQYLHTAATPRTSEMWNFDYWHRYKASIGINAPMRCAWRGDVLATRQEPDHEALCQTELNMWTWGDQADHNLEVPKNDLGEFDASGHHTPTSGFYCAADDEDPMASTASVNAVLVKMWETQWAPGGVDRSSRWAFETDAHDASSTTAMRGIIMRMQHSCAGAAAYTNTAWLLKLTNTDANGFAGIYVQGPNGTSSGHTYGSVDTYGGYFAAGGIYSGGGFFTPPPWPAGPSNANYNFVPEAEWYKHVWAADVQTHLADQFIITGAAAIFIRHTGGNPAAIVLPTGGADDVYLLYPLDLPDGVMISSSTLCGMRNGGATILEAHICKQNMMSPAYVSLALIQAFSDTGGAFAIQNSGPYSIPFVRDPVARYWIRIHMKNNGVSGNTVAFRALIINGTVGFIHGAGGLMRAQ